MSLIFTADGRGQRGLIRQRIHWDMEAGCSQGDGKAALWQWAESLVQMVGVAPDARVICRIDCCILFLGYGSGDPFWECQLSL